MESKKYINPDPHWGSEMSKILNRKESDVNVGVEFLPVELIITN